MSAFGTGSQQGWDNSDLGLGGVMLFNSRVKKELAEGTEKETETFSDTIQAKIRGRGLNRVVTMGPESMEKYR